MKFKTKLVERGSSMYIRIPVFVKKELELDRKDVISIDMLKEEN